MTVQFAVLGSGSRGNSALIGHGGPGILIDIGLGPRILGQRMASVGSSWPAVQAVILTHTHGDHLDPTTLEQMARCRIPLYCHERHRLDLVPHAGFAELDRHGLVRHFDGRPFLAPGGFRVEPIPAMHDAEPTFGFRLEIVAGRRSRAVAIGYLADTGNWSEAMAESLADVDILGVEFNHDVEMQRSSGRPPFLIKRILGDRGHLSNLQGAELVGSILKRSGRDKVAHLVLLHLSQQCNHPGLALEAARAAVAASGRRTTTIHAAIQTSAHPNLQVVNRRGVDAGGTTPFAPPRPRSGGRRIPAAMSLLPGFDDDAPWAGDPRSER